MNNLNYKSFAFISYSHRDMAVATWLQKSLESFKLPTRIHNEIDAESRYIRPVFRDRTDITTGVLGNELRRHLEESKFLIVICSKHSANSQWVSQEAKTFVELGRLEQIIPVIVHDGAATPELELFPEFLRHYFEEHPASELLGVNLGEVGRQVALIRVVSRMLGVSFDSLWKRHQRQRRARMAAIVASSVFALAAAYLFALPVSVSVNVALQQSQLPVGREVVLNVDGADYSAATESPCFAPVRVPGYKRFSSVGVRLRSEFFRPVDTMVAVGMGLRRHVTVNLLRDKAFAQFEGHVYDPELRPLEGAEVCVLNHKSLSDSLGRFSIELPLDEQREELPISITRSGYRPIGRPDEVPGRELQFIMHPL